MYILYEDPSLLDGEPIVVIGIPKSSNSKTGGMFQTIIMRSDIDPITASRQGADFSVCGNCVHRGVPHSGKTGGAKKRSCYVMLLMVLSVYKKYKAGGYIKITGHDAIADIGRGLVIRLGAYGDPAAVPSYLWDSLISEADGFTGYSHQGDFAPADYRPDLTMRSADTLEQARLAWANGERTFRVTNSVDDIVKGKEIPCPASEEAGKRTTCDNCKLCMGNRINAKSIVIVAHGAGSKHYAAA
jgi:hypothetical protein